MDGRHAASEPDRAADREVRSLLAAKILTIPGAQWVTPEEIARLYPVQRHDDPVSNRMGHIPSLLDHIWPFDRFTVTKEDLPRTAQLTQRTNQFNCTTIRRTEPGLGKLWRDGQLEGLTVRVSDRFGDYGLVGTALYKTNGPERTVDTLAR